jgi:signal transduction histidine kinase
MMTSASKAEDCKIRVDAPAAAPVTGDRDELLQVVQNLIENAIKYGRSDKGIDVTVTSMLPVARCHCRCAIMAAALPKSTCQGSPNASTA